MFNQVYGLDVAKNVFHVVGIDKHGVQKVSRKLRRGEVISYFESLPRGVVGIEGCGTAHYWGRELSGLGFEARLVSAKYVRAFARGHKSDARDAAAICEAVARESTPTRAPRTRANQEAQSLLVVREQLVGQRVRAANCLRSLLAEFGSSAPLGQRRLEEVARAKLASGTLGNVGTQALGLALAWLRSVSDSVAEVDDAVASRSTDPSVARLVDIPGVGPLTALALSAEIADTEPSRSARDFCARIGLVPRQYSSGGRARLFSITKGGGNRLRKLLFLSAMNARRAEKRREDYVQTWLGQLDERRPAKVVIIAFAARIARIAWAVSSNQCAFQRSRLNPTIT